VAATDVARSRRQAVDGLKSRRDLLAVRANGRSDKGLDVLLDLDVAAMENGGRVNSVLANGSGRRTRRSGSSRSVVGVGDLAGTGGSSCSVLLLADLVGASGGSGGRHWREERTRE
jgi:hypothetical protein